MPVPKNISINFVISLIPFFPLSLVQMLAFFQTVFTFYHQGYELAKDFDHYKKALQINIQNVSKNVIMFLTLIQKCRSIFK